MLSSKSEMIEEIKENYHDGDLITPENSKIVPLKFKLGIHEHTFNALYCEALNTHFIVFNSREELESLWEDLKQEESFFYKDYLPSVLYNQILQNIIESPHPLIVREVIIKTTRKLKSPSLPNHHKFLPPPEYTNPPTLVEAITMEDVIIAEKEAITELLNEANGNEDTLLMSQKFKSLMEKYLPSVKTSNSVFYMFRGRRTPYVPYYPILSNSQLKQKLNRYLRMKKVATFLLQPDKMNPLMALTAKYNPIPMPLYVIPLTTEEVLHILRKHNISPSSKHIYFYTYKRKYNKQTHQYDVYLTVYRGNRESYERLVAHIDSLSTDNDTIMVHNNDFTALQLIKDDFGNFIRVYNTLKYDSYKLEEVYS